MTRNDIVGIIESLLSDYETDEGERLYAVESDSETLALSVRDRSGHWHDFKIEVSK